MAQAEESGEPDEGMPKLDRGQADPKPNPKPKPKPKLTLTLRRDTVRTKWLMSNRI